jgi:hypothetical protein
MTSNEKYHLLKNDPVFKAKHLEIRKASYYKHHDDEKEKSRCRYYERLGRPVPPRKTPAA